MKLKVKSAFLSLLLLVCLYASGQMEQYRYKREVSGIKDQWHSIILPNEVFGKALPDLSDIRIFGVTESRDTIEAPYILRLSKEKVFQKDIPFTRINQSQNDKGYYFTFEVSAVTPVNEINLHFKQQNFDWKADLEGSQDMHEWFTIVSDYRILSIKNELTDFQFTTIDLPQSEYRYYRLRVNGKSKPELIAAHITLNEVTDGHFIRYNAGPPAVYQDRQNRQTTLFIDLALPLPVCKLQLFIRDNYDYYRPVTITYLSDSFKTERGWQYTYSSLTTGTLNSIEKNEFKFTSTVLQKLKIIIENHDNEPLHIDSVAVQGYVHELIVRFTQPASYSLVYGNSRATKPNYDIDRFTEKIPATSTVLQLGESKLIEKQAVKETGALFQNKALLWGVLSVIIFLLGWFTVSMMKKKE